MRIVILGASSILAQGLAARLQSDGHTCVGFSRGPLGHDGSLIRGPIELVHENPHWPESADWIINCILLRDRSIEENVEYCRNILALARRLKCRGVVHISSVAAYRFDRKVVTEKSTLETRHENKPFYAGVKIATDQALLQASDGMPVIFVRPGFILAPSHPNLIVGTAAKIFGGWIMLLGNPRQFFPVTTRATVQEALARIVRKEAWPHAESFLVVDPQSPNKREYVRACMSDLGQGTHLFAVGRWFWWPAALAGELLARIMGQKHPNVWQRINMTFRGITYDSSATEKLLEMSLKSSWRDSLRQAYDGQQLNCAVLAAPPPMKESGWASLSSVLFIGFGSIVGQKHLPALRQLGFKGRLEIFDPALKAPPDLDVPARLLKRPDESDAKVAIVASPPAFHVDALASLPSSIRTVLMEKPLALSQSEVARAIETARARGIRLIVLHNYRYKKNVLALHDFMRRFNPGALRSAQVLVNTGYIGGDSSAWRSRERSNRTLLYDFALHYLDLVASLGSDYQGVTDLDWKVNQRGDTDFINGTARFSNFPLQFRLAQGRNLTRHHVCLDFTNYSVRLTFHPDTFTVNMGNDMILNRFYEGFNELGFLIRWIWGQIRKRDQDNSHVRAFAYALQETDAGKDDRISMGQVEKTYRLLDDIGRTVYGEA